MTTSEEDDDPYLRHFRRDPLPDAGVRILLLTDRPGDRAAAIIDPIADLLRSLGREVEARVESIAPDGFAHAIARGLAGAHLPLVLLTTADEPWTDAHLRPMVAEIDHCDHVIGRRPAPGWPGVRRWLASLPRRVVFAVPLPDVHSPCRLHRLGPLARIPLQSASSLVDLEILAKATFFGHLIADVDVPPLAATVHNRGSWADLRRLLKEPTFAVPSGPSEEAQGQREADHGPGREDGQRRGDVDHPGSLQDHPTQGAGHLGQGQGLDERLGGVGESLR